MKRSTPMQAIRDFCIECMGGSVQEVRNCACMNCKLYKYRFGKKSSESVYDSSDSQDSKQSDKKETVKKTKQTKQVKSKGKRKLTEKQIAALSIGWNRGKNKTKEADKSESEEK